MRHFQADIRKALTQYALVPVFIMVLIGAILGLINWEQDVVERSDESRRAVADVVSGLIQDYEGRTDYIAENWDIETINRDTSQKVELYSWLYHEVNINHDDTSFYIIDTEGNIIVSNKDNFPEYMQGLPDDWGIFHRMKNDKEHPVMEFSPRQAGKNSDMMIGRSIWQDGELRGYTVFIIPAQYLTNNISSSYVDFALVTSFGYVPVTTGNYMRLEKFSLLKKDFIDKNAETVSIGDNYYYVTKESIANDRLTVYSGITITELRSRYIMGAGVLLAVFIIMVPIILYRAHRESMVRAREADELIEAFSELKHGQMDSKMKIHAGGDFAVVASAYNHMVDSLNDLMQLNEARAKATAVSEVRLLEAQFHPHFLFNTLENIKFMVKLDPDAAMKMIIELSGLMRYSIKNLMQEVTMAEDWQHTSDYLDILKHRFGQRLNCEFDVQVDMEELCVPKLIIQPVIENAVKYGEAEDGSISIKVQAYQQDYRLMILVTNGGKGIPEDVLTELNKMFSSQINNSTHIGLYNVHRRLQLLYGDSYGLRVESGENANTIVKISLPIRHVSKKNSAQGDEN